MATSASRPDAMAPIKCAPPEVQTIIKEVLKLEHEHVWSDKPRLNEDVVQIVKSAIADSGGGE